MNLKINCLFSIIILVIQTTAIISSELTEEVDSENQQLSNLFFSFIQKLFFPRAHFKNYLFPVNKNPPKNINCSDLVYKTEANMFETLMRELLNNMYVNDVGSTNSDEACKKIQLWIEKLVNIFKTKQCNNVYVNNKLLDVITVLCKQTNKQIEYATETFRDAMKPLETLVNECIKNIINGDYHNARRKLNLISGDDKIRYIVEQIFTKCCNNNNNENNFNKILNFFKTVGNARKCYIAYEFLFEKLENSVDVDVWDIYNLYDSSSRIINYRTYPEIKSDASNLHQKLRKKLVIFVCEELCASYLHETPHILYESNLLININRYYKNIYFDGFKMFIHKSAKNNSIELMEFTRRRKFIEEMILGLKAIDETMQLNDTEKLSLALHIKYLSIVLNKSGQEENLVHLQKKLPISIKNILFTQTVCIKNLGHNEYILVNESLLNEYKPQNRSSRSVIVQPIKFDNLVWNIKCPNNYSCKDQFYIYNNDDLQSLLLSVDCNYTNFPSTNECKIIVKTSDNKTKYDLWQIVPFGNYCYIKNVGLNGYIYVNDYNDIAIDMPGHSYVTAKNYQWYIENCSRHNIEV